MIERQSRRRPSRIIQLLALMGALSLILAACGSNKDGNSDGASPNIGGATTADEGTPVKGGEVVLAVESETNSYAPWTFAGTAAGYNAAWTIFDPLVIRDDENKVVPYLAASVTPSADLLEYTVKLRPNVSFSDGEKLTAQVQKDSFDRFLKGGKGTRRLTDIKDVDRVEVVDELTYKYVMKVANAAFPDILVGPTGWPFSVKGADALGDDFGSKPSGTGPFILQAWSRDNSFVATRNPSYWQPGLPHLDTVTIKPIPDEDARNISMQAGDIDASHSVRLSNFLLQMRDLARTGAVKMYEAPGNSGSGTIINTSKAPTDDVRVRKAMAHAMNQADLITVVAGKDAVKPRTTYYTPESAWFSQKASDLYPKTDLAKAKDFVNQYVNDPKRSDGKPVGAPIAFRFDCTAIPSLQAQAQAYQSQWKAAGLEVEIRPVEQSVHIQEALAGDFQAKCWRQGSDNDPYTYMSSAHGAGSTGNFTRYSSPAITAGLTELGSSLDQAKRYAALEKIQIEISEQVPVLWTGGNQEFIVAKPAFRGIGSWKTPDGGKGGGANGGITLWGQVWKATK